MTWSPSTSTGTWPRGLMARKAASFCSPLCSLTITGSKSAPAVSSRLWGTKEQAPGAKYSFMDMASPRSAAGPQGFAGQREVQFTQARAQGVVNGRQLQPLALEFRPLLHHVGGAHAALGQRRELRIGGRFAREIAEC